ncbi:MAG: 4a-hydroxytetrahydrobiopterin dehydratase [Thermoanaerobaculia bacterium]|nr:4a-hydroxytetrahydrobiopterin dehydratase [Thermoanaerobaculia bacterium]
MPQKLDDESIRRELATVPTWQRAGDEIRRSVSLPSFRAALAFVAYVGELAEAANHHPDIDLRYNRVDLALTTHSAGGLTTNDFELARHIG